MKESSRFPSTSLSQRIGSERMLVDSRQAAILKQNANSFFRILLWLSGAILFFSLMTSCSKPRPPFAEIEEPSYARGVLEKILVSIGDADYETYVSYKHPSMLAANSKEIFEGQVAFVGESFGDYVVGSATFSNASFQFDSAHRIGTTVVDYYAEFTKKSKVLVEIAFREINGRTWVEDVGFNTRATYY